MIQSRKIRLIYQCVYCALAVLGFLAQLGLFSGVLNRSYLVFYTNLSNLLCMLYGFCSLARTIREEKDGYCSFAPGLKFVFTIMISITFILYNGLLAHYSSILAYFSSLKNSLNHCILPVLFVLEWVLFYRRGQVRWIDPLLSAGPPLAYVVYILVRAAMLDAAGKQAAVVYPYFFLNLSSLGWGGFLRWMGVLMIAFLALGYALCLLDRWMGRKTAVKL